MRSVLRQMRLLSSSVKATCGGVTSTDSLAFIMSSWSPGVDMVVKKKMMGCSVSLSHSLTHLFFSPWCPAEFLSVSTPTPFWRNPDSHRVGELVFPRDPPRLRLILMANRVPRVHPRPYAFIRYPDSVKLCPVPLHLSSDGAESLSNPQFS